MGWKDTLRAMEEMTVTVGGVNAPDDGGSKDLLAIAVVEWKGYLVKVEAMVVRMMVCVW